MAEFEPDFKTVSPKDNPDTDDFSSYLFYYLTTYSLSTGVSSLVSISSFPPFADDLLIYSNWS